MNKWDLRFLEMAKLVGSFSKDPSSKVGAIIVRPDKTICSVGYNGFPRWIQDTPELLENREEKYKRIIHCEMNAILSSREKLVGYTLYTWPFSCCSRCTVHVIQAGIAEVVAPINSELEGYKRWKEDLDFALSLFQEAGVQVHLIELPLKAFNPYVSSLYVK